tara:strand:+ start:254 stop:730 length:477 start_codon:yes stop_codon:yes gene_type:complete
MSIRYAVIGISLLLGFTSGGCAIGTQKSGRVIDGRRIGEIKVGVSTKQDVLDAFGPPNSYSRVGATVSNAGPSLLGRPGPGAASEGPASAQGALEAKAAEDVFVYEYTEDHEAFFTLLLFTYFRRDTISDRLMVFFDTKDVVKYLAFAKQTDAEPDDE